MVENPYKSPCTEGERPQYQPYSLSVGFRLFLLVLVGVFSTTFIMDAMFAFVQSIQRDNGATLPRTVAAVPFLASCTVTILTAWLLFRRR